MPSAPLSRSYDFHGLGLTVSADHAAILAGIAGRLRHFPASARVQQDLAYAYACAPTGPPAVSRPAEPGRTVFDLPQGEIVYFDAGDRLYLSHAGQGRALCDLGRGQVCVSLLQPEGAPLWLGAHLLFTIPLLEVAKRRGLFPVHAAGVCLDGRGLLLPGASGSGKTTLALALLRAGFGLLGDDTVFLRSGPEGLRVLAFPDEFDLTPETIRLFPELRHLMRRPLISGRTKRPLRPEALYETRVIWECPPVALVFPRVAQRATSVLRPLGQDEAFLELAPNVLLTEARSSQAHLDALAELVRTSACYRLEVGRDLDALPALVRPLLG